MRENVDVDLHGLTLVLVAGMWLGGIFLGSLLPLPSPSLLIGMGTTLLCMLLLWHDSQGRFIMLLIFCLLSGAWRYTFVSPDSDPQNIAAYIGTNSINIDGTVSEEPTIQGHTRILTITVSTVSKNNGFSWQDAHGQLTVLTLGTLIEDPYKANYGDRVELQGTLQAPSLHAPPGIFASMAFPNISVKSADGNPVISFLYHLRVILSNIIEQSLPQPASSLLIAILLSLRTPALRPLIPYFNTTGTAHLIAPSGFKVTILAGLVSRNTLWLHKRRHLQRLLPAQKRDRWPRWLATTLIMASIVAYTLLSGAGPAALRSGIMGILLVIAPRLGRTYNIYTALALTVLLMSMFNPFILWDAGFLLSVLGTLGIVLLTPFFQRLLSPLERLPFGHSFVEIIAVTLAAQTATLPIFIVTFQQISLIAPIANLLTVPLLGTMIIMGVLISGTGLFFTPLAILCGWVVWPLLWYLTNIVIWCSQVPYASINASNMNSNIAWFYYGFLALFIRFALKKWPLPSKQSRQAYTHAPVISQHIWQRVQFATALLAILAIGGAALLSHSKSELTITFLNVGPAGQPSQGEAILIHTPDGQTILIDGGLDATSLSQSLSSHLPIWQRSLDTVLLTSTRLDHLNGLQEAISHYQVGEIIDGGMLHPNTTYALWQRTISERHFRYIPVVQGMTIPVGSQVALQVLWPGSHLYKGNDEARDNGLVLRLVAPGLHMLLLGATAQSTYALSGLINTLDPNFLQAEIVQIVGEVAKPFPSELEEVLKKAHPSLLVITPASLSAKQRKLGISSSSSPLLSGVASWQTLQTAKLGTIEIMSNHEAWSMNIV